MVKIKKTPNLRYKIHERNVLGSQANLVPGGAAQSEARSEGKKGKEKKGRKKEKKGKRTGKSKGARKTHFFLVFLALTVNLWLNFQTFICDFKITRKLANFKEISRFLHDFFF